MGLLDEPTERQLELMASKLQKTFNIDGAWQQMVIAQLKFPPNIQERIAEMWRRNQAIAAANGTTLEPAQFVQMFVDRNVVGDT